MDELRNWIIMLAEVNEEVGVAEVVGAGAWLKGLDCQCSAQVVVSSWYRVRGKSVKGYVKSY